jgi:signal transduction histidine kinase
LIEESGRAFAVKTVFDAPETLPDLPPEMAAHLYRITQEAIHNAVKHGQTTSIWLHLGHEAGVLKLSVVNDGAPFQPPAADASTTQGMGLRIMQYRAEALGARLQIKSAPGGGSQVLCTVPLIGTGRA